MKNLFYFLFFGLMVVSACTIFGKKDKTVYLEISRKISLGFFESVEHITDTAQYGNMLFFIKFGGIENTHLRRYQWLRDPENLTKTFNTAMSIGLDRFISKEQYYEKNSDWCCDNEWENKSLDDVVKGYVHSDTISSVHKYYLEFWNRRRKEGNLKTVYGIFKEIDQYYAGGKNIKSEPVDTVLKSLLEFDIRLSHAHDSLEYPAAVLDYFIYLKSVGMDYSAYKLVFHNSRLGFTKQVRDSLLASIPHDTISRDDWYKIDDNQEGWIRGFEYADPQRSYGP